MDHIDDIKSMILNQWYQIDDIESIDHIKDIELMISNQWYQIDDIESMISNWWYWWYRINVSMISNQCYQIDVIESYCIDNIDCINCILLYQWYQINIIVSMISNQYYGIDITISISISINIIDDQSIMNIMLLSIISISIR